MPLYEYYCEPCNGVYEAIRPMRESSLAVPCPECDRDGERVMSAFSAFTYREGYPRRLPDKGTYWHFGTEVQKRAKRMSGGTVHPELEVPKQRPTVTKGDAAASQQEWGERQGEMGYREKQGVGAYNAKLPKARKVKKRRTTLSSSGRSDSKD